MGSPFSFQETAILAKVPEKVLNGMREKLAGYTAQRRKAQEALDALH